MVKASTDGIPVMGPFFKSEFDTCDVLQRFLEGLNQFLIDDRFQVWELLQEGFGQ